MSLKKYIWNIYINCIVSSKLVPLYIKYIVYKSVGMNIQSPYIHDDVFFGSNNIVIKGNGTSINKGCFFYNENGARVEIGSNCAISYQVIFCTATHEIGDSNRRSGKAYGSDIVIKDGCWIGARTTILPGVTIGKGCIIAAGSVVTRNCEANSLYAGNPAIKKKKLI